MKMVCSLTDELHGEVAAMNRENFIVRMHLEAVNRFRERNAWKQLSESDVEVLQLEIAGLPNEIEKDDIESRMFDLTALRMQLALAEGNETVFERDRQLVVEIAMLLEEKSTIPAVKTQLGNLAALQETDFWEGIGLRDLEDLRLRLRGIVPFLDKKKRKIVYNELPRRGSGGPRKTGGLHAEDDRGPVREKGQGIPPQSSQSLGHPPAENLPTAHRCRPEWVGINPGRDRRRGRGNVVFWASFPQRVAIARSFRKEPGRAGSKGCAGRRSRVFWPIEASRPPRFASSKW